MKKLLILLIVTPILTFGQFQHYTTSNGLVSNTVQCFKESPYIAITITLLFVTSLQFLKEKDIEDNFKYYEQLVN